MEDDFYASIKLINGEEILARVMPCVDGNNINLILNNPVVLSEVSSRNGINGYKIEPWIKTTSEDMFILSMEKVLTISENLDEHIIEMHQSFVRKFNTIKNKNSNNVTRRMGYITNVKDAKILLEKIYKES